MPPQLAIKSIIASTSQLGAAGELEQMAETSPRSPLKTTARPYPEFLGLQDSDETQPSLHFGNLFTSVSYLLSPSSSTLVAVRKAILVRRAPKVLAAWRRTTICF